MSSVYKLLALWIVSAALSACVSAQAQAPTALQTAEPAAPAEATSVEERYIYLSTLQYMAQNTSPAFMEALSTISGKAMASQDIPTTYEGAQTRLNDPLLLQADPASIVALGQELLALTGLQQDTTVNAYLAAMEAEVPALKDEALQLAVLENGVRFRFALAQALYATDLRALPRDQQDAVDTYINATTDLRDDMEVLAFDVELEAMTGQALEQYRGAYTALQRGALMDLNPYSFIADGDRALLMSNQAIEGIASSMRGTYLQLILIYALIMN